MNRTERRHNTYVNKWFANSCEIARSEYLDLKNKLKLVQHTSNEHDLLLEQFERKFKEYKQVIRVAKRNYENEFHNKLRNMKSENCKDYWSVLNEHSPDDPDKFVINLEVLKFLKKNLNRNSRNNHVTSILNSQLIANSYTSENKDINIPFTVQEVTAAIKRLKGTLQVKSIKLSD